MKNLIIASIVILSLASFSQDKEARYREALVAHNKKVVSYFFNALEKKDYKALNSIIDYTGTGIWADQRTQSSDTLKGRDAIGSQLKSSVDGFYKVRYSTKIQEGTDPAAITVKTKSISQTADGTKTTRDYLITFKLKDGKITEYTEYYNSGQPQKS